MKSIITIFFALFFSIGCNSQSDIVEETNETFDNSKAQLIEIEYQELKEKVDYIYDNLFSEVELYIQVDNNGKIERVPNYDSVPELINSSYNIIRDNDGNVILIAEYPFSESGDWDLTYENYFDKSGNLIAFVRKSSFFNGICAEIVRERSIYYYDKGHNLVRKSYEIKDSDENILDFIDCIFNYRYEYDIYKTLTVYFENYKFE